MIHAALVMLRWHRGRAPVKYLQVLPSAALTVVPWAFGSWASMSAALALHGGWFLGCEWVNQRRDRAADIAPVSIAGSSVTLSRSAPRIVLPRGQAFVPVTVKEVLPEGAGIRTFRMSRPRDFRFLPGQFLPVRVEIDGHPHVRCYSLSSSPDVREYLEISVRRQGRVSSWLHDHVARGGTLSVRPPAGQFVYPANSRAPLVLVAGGIGITPVLSMLRYAVKHDPDREVTLLYSVRGHDDIAFEQELDALAHASAHVRVVITLTGSCAVDRYRYGRIDDALVRSTVSRPESAIYLMCGPSGLLDAVRALARSLGAPDGNIRSETFEAAAAFGATLPPGAAATTPARSCRLRLETSALETEVDTNETLLEAAERVGADIPSLCRAGACGTCRTRLLRGEVNGNIDTEHGTNGPEHFVLPCISRPVADCTIEA